MSDLRQWHQADAGSVQAISLLVSITVKLPDGVGVVVRAAVSQSQNSWFKSTWRVMLLFGFWKRISAAYQGLFGQQLVTNRFWLNGSGVANTAAPTQKKNTHTHHCHIAILLLKQKLKMTMNYNISSTNNSLLYMTSLTVGFLQYSFFLLSFFFFFSFFFFAGHWFKIRVNCDLRSVTHCFFQVPWRRSRRDLRVRRKGRLQGRRPTDPDRSGRAELSRVGGQGQQLHGLPHDSADVGGLYRVAQVGQEAHGWHRREGGSATATTKRTRMLSIRKRD